MTLFADPINAAVIAAFAEPITWTPEGGPETELQSIFDDGWLVVENQDGQPVTVREAKASVLTSAVTGIARGAGIEARGKTYRVADIRPDGQGVTTLVLEAVDAGS